MNTHSYSTIVLVAALGIGLAACGESSDDSAMPAAQSGMPDMPNMPAADGDAGARTTHVAEGTLNSFDLAAGTANISHGPIASANWPEMTMGFKLADPDSIRAFEPGQRIRFEFTIEEGMSATVTDIEAND